MKPVNSGNAVAGAAVLVAGGGVPAAASAAARVPLRELMDDRLLDALLERSRAQAGGLRVIGYGDEPFPDRLFPAGPGRA